MSESDLEAATWSELIASLREDVRTHSCDDEGCGVSVEACSGCGGNLVFKVSRHRPELLIFCARCEEVLEKLALVPESKS